MKQQTKVTGKWTSQSALDLGEPLSLITESVFARYISSLKDQRVAASKVLSGPQAQPAGDKAEFIEKVRRALYLGKIVSYAQASLSCVRRLKNTTGILITAKSRRFSVLAASSVRSSCRKSPMLMPKIRRSLTCCWSILQANRRCTSRRCAMSSLMQYRTVSRSYLRCCGCLL